MKINRLETHDRLKEFKKQSDLISKGCQDCIANRPKAFANHPFYIFCHKREVALDEKQEIYLKDLNKSLTDLSYKRLYATIESVPSLRYVWCPRLTKPEPQTNSMLFRAYPPGDNIKVLWILPEIYIDGQYDKGKMMENEIVVESVHKFLNCRDKLSAPEDDELPEATIKAIYSEMKFEKQDPYLKIFNSLLC